MPEIIAGFRPSSVQKRLWSLQEGAADYASRCLVRLAGPLDAAALRKALGLVTGRHDVLRTGFRRRPGIRFPIQVVAETAAGFFWRTEDLRTLTATKREEQIAELFRAEVDFDLETGPVIDAVLIAVGEDEHLLRLVLPALCADLGALQILVRELVLAYGGRTDELEEEPLQHVQFSEWQNNLLEEEDSAQALERWRKRWMALPPDATLPFEMRVAEPVGFRPEEVIVRLGAAASAAAAELVAERGATRAAFLLSCWQVLLCRLTGRSQLAVWRTFEGRKYDVLAGMVGTASKCLPLRAGFEADYRFGEVLAETQAASEAAWEDLEYFAWPQEDVSSAAIFYCAGFEWLELPAASQARGVSFEIRHQRADIDRFRIALLAVGDGADCKLALRYDPAFFRRSDVERWAGHLLTLVEGALASPDMPVSDLPLLSEEERVELLSEWGVGVGAIPPTGCVHHLVESWAEREPGRPALVCGTARLSYGELVDRSHRLAYRLRRLGVGPESRVALFLPRSLDSVVGLLAVLAAGGAYVPLEPGTPAERVAFLLADSGSQVVVTHRSLLGSLPAWVETICLDGDPDPLAGEDLGVLSAEAGPENLAYVIFTSGSTGQPKGVAVEHRQLWHYVHAVRSGLELPEGGSYAMVSTFAADLGHTSLYPSLCFGGCLHVIAEQQASDPFALAEYFERNPVDCLKIVPSHLAAVEQYAPAGRLLPRQRLILGGEISRPEWVERLVRTAPPTCTICNHYGPTETTVGVLAYRLMNGSAPRESASLPIGRPLGANRAYVLGGGMRPVPVGVAGELYLGGAGVSRGYLGRPVQTAERFVPDPFGGPGLRLYRTGDQARWLPTGDVEFLGRADHQVKIRGFRVELGEIESALTRHPAVREAVVVAREDQPGERRLVAYIVPAESPPSPLELRAFLRSELPEYMLPAAWMVIPELPLTANGKVDRQALPIPDVDAAEILEHVAPRTPTEELLAGLWSRILRIDRVGAHDDFFELGGHSLLAAQLVFRVREAFGIHLRVAALFEQPTLAGLAAVVDSTRRASQGLETPPIARVPRGGPLPQSYAQQRLWLMEQLDDKSLAYNIPQAIQLRGRVDVPALERSFTELARRHETLRTTLDVKDGEPVQFIHPARPVVLPAVDLTALSAALREATVQKLTLAEAQAKFDLARGPLFRIRLLRQQDGEDLLLFTQHHVIGDGWSMRILTHEIASLYEAFRLGRPSPLPELVLQYGDYSVWQRNLLEGEVLKAHLDYWKRQLDGAPPLVTLPTDRPRPVRQKFRGANYYTSLPAAAADEIDRASRAEGVTLFMTLLAAFQVLLHQYSGQDDIVVGADIAGRDRIETEPMIGFFVNEVVLRTRMNGAETFDEVLSRARETCLGAYLHQDLPFLRLVEELRPERDLSYMPLFQVSLILRYAPAADVALEGIDLADFNIDHGWARMDLSLNVVRHREGLYLWALYDADLFDRETISRVLEVYKALLLTIAARPGIRMEELRVFLAERDREQQDNEVRSVAEAHRQKLGRIRPRVSRFLNIEPEAMEAVAVTLEGAS